MTRARFFLIACSIVIASISTSSTHAEIYRWKDANGNVQFSDQNIGHPSAKTVSIKVNSYNHVSYAAVLKSFDLAPSANVVLYGTTWCGYCKKARDYFQQNRIAYTEYDVEHSPKGKADYLKLQGHGVPIILVGNKRMNGFDASAFQKMYVKK